MLRILVDYNTIDENGRVDVDERGNEGLLSQLVHHIPIVVYDWDNLEFDAIAEFDEKYQAWFAKPDWSTRREPPLKD